MKVQSLIQFGLWRRRDCPLLTISVDGALANSIGKSMKQKWDWPDAIYKITACSGHLIELIPKIGCTHMNEMIVRGHWKGKLLGFYFHLILYH